MKDEGKRKQKVSLKEMQKEARQYLSGLKKRFPNKSKLELFPTVFYQGGILAAKMLIEDIKRLQLDRLSIKDRILLQQFENQIQKAEDRTT